MLLKLIALIAVCVIPLSTTLAVNDLSLRGPSCLSLTSSKLCVQIGLKFYLINDVDKLNWYEAQRFCRRYNANLATIENELENRLISDYLVLKGYKFDWHKGGRGFYLSGNDLGTKPGYFFSITNGFLLPFTSWTEDRPDNIEGTEHCIHFWYKSGSSFGMNDITCDIPQNFICEFESRLTN